MDDFLTIDEFDQAGEMIQSREFTFAGDEPEQILGGRTAPNAVEVLLALGGNGPPSAGIV